MAKKILVVDDEPDIVELLTNRLKDSGYLTCSAKDGEEAIKKAREEKPHLIVLDILMPGMNGYICLKSLRSDNLTKDIPVIILTVRREKKIGDLFKIEGIEAFIEKPFEPEKLLAKIKEVLGD